MTNQNELSDQQRKDDEAVDRFAAAMKVKLAAARAKGRFGWDDPLQCSEPNLARLLVGHLSKPNQGNYEDLANFAMMLHQRGAKPLVLAQAYTARMEELEALAVRRYRFSEATPEDAEQMVADGMMKVSQAVRRTYPVGTVVHVRKGRANIHMEITGYPGSNPAVLKGFNIKTGNVTKIHWRDIQSVLGVRGPQGTVVPIQ